MDRIDRFVVIGLLFGIAYTTLAARMEQTENLKRVHAHLHIIEEALTGEVSTGLEETR